MLSLPTAGYYLSLYKSIVSFANFQFQMFTQSLFCCYFFFSLTFKLTFPRLYLINKALFNTFFPENIMPLSIIDRTEFSITNSHKQTWRRWRLSEAAIRRMSGPSESLEWLSGREWDLETREKIKEWYQYCFPVRIQNVVRENLKFQTWANFQISYLLAHVQTPKISKTLNFRPILNVIYRHFGFDNNLDRFKNLEPQSRSRF